MQKLRFGPTGKRRSGGNFQVPVAGWLAGESVRMPCRRIRDAKDTPPRITGALRLQLRTPYENALTTRHPGIAKRYPGSRHPARKNDHGTLRDPGCSAGRPGTAKLDRV